MTRPGPIPTESALPTWDEPGQSSGERVSGAPGEAPRSGALDFYTNKSPSLACEKPRIGLRLLSSDGRWAPVRCGLNGCYGCYAIKSFDRAQMVYEDALVVQPGYAITLTTRAPVWDAAVYREGKRQGLRVLRAAFDGGELGRVEMLEFMEQTSGTAPSSGGHKRGHGHNLVKGIPPGAALEIERLLVGTKQKPWPWRRIVGAWQINVSELQSAGGAVAYLTLNLALEKGKAVQAPINLPKGTRTLRPTRGYWSLPVAELKERAREHNAYRRLRHSLIRSLADEHGHVNGDFLDLVLEVEWEKHKARTWEVWEVKERPDTALFEPIKPFEGRLLEDEGLVRRRGQLVHVGSGEVWS